MKNNDKPANPWVEAMRLRTLPVSVAGVLGGLSCALLYGKFRLLPFLICLVFAVVAQIVSNFANEYYDFKHGLDKKGREGFRRGVTEGDISPKAMKRATYVLLLLDCILGCSLIIWGGWWLVFVGLFIAVFAIAYSAGPYPLSQKGLGDIAVIIFYGIIPVVFTSYVTCGSLENIMISSTVGFVLGMLADNVLIINNYRDADDDRAVGKTTTVVIFGRKTMRGVYFFNFSFAIFVLAVIFLLERSWVWIVAWAIVEALYFTVWQSMGKAQGKALNPLLKRTALLMLLSCTVMIVASAV